MARKQLSRDRVTASAKERPLASDLAPTEYRTPPAVARADKERDDFIQRYEVATGQICGLVSQEGAGTGGRLAFLPTSGYSPYGSVDAEVDRNGRFCSGRLGPGGYYLYFTRGPWGGGMQSAMYYPGVLDRVKATIVEIQAGQVRSNLVFRIQKQEVYTVRGFLSTDDKSGLGKDGAYAMLVGLDGRLWGRQSVDCRGSFPLPKVKYITFENVPSGRYIAYAFASGRGWLTRVVDVNVTSHAKLIFLELKHTKVSEDTKKTM